MNKIFCIFDIIYIICYYPNRIGDVFTTQENRMKSKLFRYLRLRTGGASIKASIGLDTEQKTAAMVTMFIELNELKVEDFLDEDGKPYLVQEQIDCKHSIPCWNVHQHPGRMITDLERFLEKVE